MATKSEIDALVAKQAAELDGIDVNDVILVDRAVLACTLMLIKLPYELRVIAVRHLREAVDLDNPNRIP